MEFTGAVQVWLEDFHYKFVFSRRHVGNVCKANYVLFQGNVFVYSPNICYSEWVLAAKKTGKAVSCTSPAGPHAVPFPLEDSQEK